MNRRGFLGLTASALGCAVLDPERLLWVPGKKRIFVPPPTAPPQFAWKNYSVSIRLTREELESQESFADFVAREYEQMAKNQEEFFRREWGALNVG